MMARTASKPPYSPYRGCGYQLFQARFHTGRHRRVYRSPAQLCWRQSRESLSRLCKIPAACSEGKSLHWVSSAWPRPHNHLERLLAFAFVCWHLHHQAPRHLGGQHTPNVTLPSKAAAITGSEFFTRGGNAEQLLPHTARCRNCGGCCWAPCLRDGLTLPSKRSTDHHHSRCMISSTKKGCTSPACVTFFAGWPHPRGWAYAVPVVGIALGFAGTLASQGAVGAVLVWPAFWKDRSIWKRVNAP